VPGDPDGPAPLTVVKLGGSVITRKQREERLRPKVLERLADEIVRAGVPTVVLHGAGSFGHPGAVRFGLARAPADGVTADHRSRGAAIVATEVRRLHLAVLQALVRAGGRPASIPISTHATNSSGRLTALDPAPFRAALRDGRLPVSFGDVVPDTDWGSSILSADTIASYLAGSLQVDRVLFVSDVPGVFDPSRPADRVVLPLVEATLPERLSVRTHGADVTGGIQGKVREMLAISAGGADAGLISGLSDGTLLRALRGERVHGSWAIAAHQ
jgi:isopentenyl phosphate kinase